MMMVHRLQIQEHLDTDRSSEYHEVYEIFFMNRHFSIDPKIDEGTQQFFKRLIWTLIVLNILIGVPTIYDIYLYEETPEILRDTSTITTDEV